MKKESDYYYYFQSELADIISTFDVRSGESYSLQGKIYHLQSVVQEEQEKASSSGYLSKLLVSHLSNTMYQIYHCRKGEGAYKKGTMVAYHHSSSKFRDFIETLSKANTGHGTWEPGWEVRKIEGNGQLAAYKDGLTLWISPKQFLLYDDGEIAIGKKGYIAMVKEFRTLLPGFYMANGDAPLDQTPPLTRIYWNVDSQDAALLLNVLTRELNNEDIPFQFKILSDPGTFYRMDAGVLYISKRHLEKSKNALKNIYGRTRKTFKPETSLFCKRLAPGVSLAEDPKNGESFGQHRTRLLAEAMYQTHEKNILTKEEKFDNVSAYFAKSGVDIRRPYLNSGSVDDYDTMLEGVFN